ncbi:ubiquitin carboxyl-terminal hydrolase MINDY-3 homolog [Topomyia yanbarensis]|uniref:ubiquitin carboxyl-terminal hydrolase MINDY-3 homolog n=1 Tax=Topomyia yanbarensis TaxID=2498891 RepID=UPI00273AAC9C|nr:ubiquitin carboxyl-terminal hydrolase MINDY-3 homolog [Topomyia yanbarensis]
MGEHSLPGQSSASEQQQPVPVAQSSESAGTSGRQQHQQQQQGVQDLREICQLLWGSSIRQEVFRRWSQGFEFSESEPSALVQRDGGPCCVIAPVQAYLLKILLMETPGHSFSDLTTDKCKALLIQAICQILTKCKMTKYRVVSLKPRQNPVHAGGSVCPVPETDGDSEMVDALENLPPNEDVVEVGVEAMAPAADVASDLVNQNTAAASSDVGRAVALEPWTAEAFHERLTVTELERIDDVEKYYAGHFQVLADECGVLLLLYTVLLTKGLDNVLSEVSDTSEPLIHGTYGYGSQALINLMLTGRAVPYVWDNEQDVGGLKLKGITQQSDIGFITLMEQMQYCTVGYFYKNPKSPVWVMGSETHLTVLFSNEKRLVSPETPSEVARRVFRQFDTEGSNFIPSPLLQDVLCALDLVSEPEYVDLMRKKLDPESLGIILLNEFMYEFFPTEKKSIPDTFDLLHYNGIPNSNCENRVRYAKGHAILLESDVRMCNPSDPMLTCLQTKWPNIEVNWNDSRTPSLN